MRITQHDLVVILSNEREEEMKRFAIILVGCIFVSLLLACPLMAVEYDLVVLNGRVMDPETMYDAIANVGIKNGRIAVITKDKISGAETINAKGLVVSPGFIDTHVHGVDPFTTKMVLRDGVTTAMDLEVGACRVGEWYDQKAESGWQVNYGTTSSHALNRMIVHDPEVTIDKPVDFANAAHYMHAASEDGVVGWSMTKDTIETMNKVSHLLDEDLRQGALGLAATPAYMARGLTTYALFEAQRVAARYGRVTAVHTRFHLSSEPPTEAPLGFDEVFANASLLDAPLLIMHDNDYGWWEIEEKLQLARAKGLNMWAEHYPYASGGTAISADFLRPEVWADIQGNRYEETIFDPQTESFFTRETFEKTVAEDPGRNIVIFMPWREEWIRYWLTMPHMAVASDAISGYDADGNLLSWDAEYSAYSGNPRTAGTHAKTLRLGREQGVPLMFQLSQLSYWPALHLGDAGLRAMKDRGRVQVGKIADLTLFDPDKVTDNSTFTPGENGLPSTGIPYVIVNGTIVVKNSKVLRDMKPVQPIRYSVEDRGRFVPVDKNRWISEKTITPIDVHVDDSCGVQEAIKESTGK
jgi:N-acyl-D-glutamate deacylase